MPVNRQRVSRNDLIIKLQGSSHKFDTMSLIPCRTVKVLRIKILPGNADVPVGLHEAGMRFVKDETITPSMAVRYNCECRAGRGIQGLADQRG